jgi:hypothetical protein
MKEHTQLQHHLHPLHLWTKCGGREKDFGKCTRTTYGKGLDLN